VTTLGNAPVSVYALGTLPSLNVPNTIEDPADPDYGKQFVVSAIDVVGNLVPDPVTGKASDDYYSFTGQAGQIMNIQAMSAALTRIAHPIDTVLYLYDSSGKLRASNDDDFESTDSSIVDYTLPQSGTYTVEVDSFNPPGGPDLNVGGYELFLYSFATAESAPQSPAGGKRRVAGSPLGPATT
jgi:hypothetical protein